jgi:hypothetical protein
MSLSSYLVERPNPESLAIAREEEENEIAVFTLPPVEGVFRRPVDMAVERFTRCRLRYMPKVEVMDETWREIIKASNRIKRAEARQRQIRRG